MISFVATDEELKDIQSGKVKKLVREIDRWNPVFEKIEKLQARYASKDPWSISSLGLIDISTKKDCETFKIKRIYYKDGSVIIEW